MRRKCFAPTMPFIVCVGWCHILHWKVWTCVCAKWQLDYLKILLPIQSLCLSFSHPLSVSLSPSLFHLSHTSKSPIHSVNTSQVITCFLFCPPPSLLSSHSLPLSPSPFTTAVRVRRGPQTQGVSGWPVQLHAEARYVAAASADTGNVKSGTHRWVPINSLTTHKH